jgi:ankyrin repeat protein
MACLTNVTNLHRFMWVRLRMQAVRLETTVEGMIQALTSFPKGLSAAYTKLLEKMENENTVEHDAAMAVIKWLVYSCVECSPDTVIQALQIKTSTIEAFEGIRGMELSRLLEICRNLVFFDQETRVIHLPHGSLKQYLQTPSNYDHWKPDEVRSWIAELCLQVLMSDEYQKHQALDCPAPQLRAYAVFNWAEHLRQTQKRSDALNDLWKGFLNINNEQYCRWAIQIRMTHSVLTGKENRPISPLWTACFYQLYDIFKALLADGADPNCHNSSGQALAHYCIQNGLDDFLNRLIDTIKISNAAGTEVDQASKVEGTTTDEKYESVRRSDLHPSFDVNAADSQGRTALFHASLLGNESIVQRLLGTKMCEVNLRDENGDNPLLIVASTGNIFIMKHLLAQDSLELNQKNEEGDTALLLATRLGFEGFVKTFLQLAADRYQRRGGSAEQSIDPTGSKMTLKITSDLQLDINCTDDLNRTPLMKAVEINHLNLVKILLKEEGLDLGVKSQYGFTALSYAAWNGYTKIIEAMLGSDKVLQQHLEFKDEDGFTPLALAAWCGYSEIVKLLLEKGADVNTRDNCGCTPLRLASYRGMQGVVREILQRKDVDFKTTNDAETTALKSATEGGYSDIIGDLLRKFITEDETDFKDEDGNNLLLLASIHGQTEVVKLLLLDKRCSDLKYVNKGGLTALEGAIKGGHTEIIRLLCESNADIEGFESYGSVMLSLAQNGPFSLFKSLLELNSDDKLEDRDEEGNDVLMRATIGGNEDIVKLLLDQRKYDPNVPNCEGLTALHIASAAKHWQILKLLHTKGAGMDSTKGLLAAALDGKNEIFQMLLEDYDDKEVLDHKDEDGDTVLLLAAIGGNVEIMRSLLNPHRCEIDYANKRGETALTLAISHRHPEVANLLLDRGVKRNISKINGWTPLHLAASTGDQNLIRRLLSYDDVDPKALTRHGSTPLLVAAETGVPEVVKLLLEKYEPRIEIPDMDEDGDMVLQAAAYSGSKETVDILLDHGKGNINHLNKAGETALIMAVTQGHKEVVQSLLGTEGIDVEIKNSDDESAFDIVNYKAMLWGEEGQHSEILTLLTAFADKSLSNGS